ncbi:SMP-30/gluconolactonase/LRE family protein [Blastopirellula sp. J2-11]|uniref:SMP-30/gluconolactonase/LRE family protein n=1 Tax=Blastopirellula sp. J2-11 TaxID=2943192 RepID=UPI0021C9335E|nr:SMP-30/gluconolactonase/LRE family protein [Blastopirellula sp. J2-11]UUO04903.1 SMP-30/gluconolactonase/LRE family protein [Blastopirellula sp. J2-11]
MQTIKANCAFDGKAILAEGPVWDADLGKLWWVDIERYLVNRWDPVTGKNESWSLGRQVGFAIPTTSGDVIAGTRNGIVRLNVESGAIIPLVDPESDISTTRFNDGKCDPRGRLFGGTISDQRIEEASLYLLDETLQIRRVVEKVTNSNGLAWSSDEKTFYYIDTATRKIDAFDYDVTSGAISNRRKAFDIPHDLGKPDGMTIDSEGMLWVALWSGWGVSRWNPNTGQMLAKVDLPCQNVTSCCFGGPNLDRLYITCARQGLSSEQLAGQSLAGGIFVADVGVSGMAGVKFAY